MSIQVTISFHITFFFKKKHSKSCYYIAEWILNLIPFFDPPTTLAERTHRLWQIMDVDIAYEIVEVDLIKRGRYTQIMPWVTFQCEFMKKIYQTNCWMKYRRIPKSIPRFFYEKDVVIRNIVGETREINVCQRGASHVFLVLHSLHNSRMPFLESQ